MREAIRGGGHETAAQIHTGAYNLDRDFYWFYRSMLAYRQAIGGSRDALVLEPDSDVSKFLKSGLGAAAVSE